MLSVYEKMARALGNVTWKARWARRIAYLQNIIIFIYFIVFSAFLWIFQYILIKLDPKGGLTDEAQIIYIAFMVPKLCFEMSIFVIFICLVRRFNNLSQDYQAEEKSNKSSCFITVAKWMTAFTMFFYFMNTLFFDVVSPLFWHYALKDSTDEKIESSYG